MLHEVVSIKKGKLELRIMYRKDKYFIYVSNGIGEISIDVTLKELEEIKHKIGNELVRKWFPGVYKIAMRKSKK